MANGCNCTTPGGSGVLEINSQACGENPCGCSRTLTPASSCNCYSPSCGCNTPQTPNPAPYYMQAGACQETHCQTLLQQQYTMGVAISSTFNMPACNATAVITMPGLIRVPIGAYLWNPTYGYLHVISFDYANSQVVVKNECQSSNAAPGTAIPSCTLFTVVDTPCCDQQTGYGPSSLFPFLAVDFTAPANGACLVIQVTNTNGLVVGKDVQISSGEYRVNDVVDGTHIEICNDGAGVTPGTTVVAQDGVGNYITPILLIDSSPCTNPAVPDGSLLVCKSGIVQPLDATAVGQIPVVVDATTNEVEYQLIDFPVRECTALTACLNLVPGTATYTITVADSSAFQNGDILQIGYRSDRFTITNIPDGTHITGTIAPVPAAFETIQELTQVCITQCCEQLLQEVEDLSDIVNDPCNWDLSDRIIHFSDQEESGAEQIGTALNSPGDNAFTTKQGLLIANTSCKTMRVIIFQDHFAEGYFVADDEDFAHMELYADFAFVTGAIGTTVDPAYVTKFVEREFAFNRTDPTIYHSEHYNFSHFVNVNPGQELRIVARTGLMLNSGDITRFVISELRAEIKYMALSII